MPLRLKLAKHSMPDSSYYVKLDYDMRRRYARLTRFIEESPKKLVCQECRGRGSFPSNDYYEPDDPCDWCKGLGFVTPHVRGLWLSYKKDEKLAKSRGISLEQLWIDRNHKGRKK